MEIYELHRDFFAVSLGQLVAGRARGFSLHIYFPLNKHLMLRFSPDYDLTSEVLERHLRLGIVTLWCPQACRASWEKYIAEGPAKPGEATLATPDASVATLDDAIDAAAAAAALAVNDATEKAPPSPEAEVAIATLESGELDAEQKGAILAEVATGMLNALGNIDPENPEQFRESMLQCKKFMDDVIRVAAKSHEMNALLEDLLIISGNDLEHSTSVATLSVLFGMCTGYSEAKILADLAFASFIHDVGMTFLDPSLLGVSPAQFDAQQQQEFEKHIALGFEFLANAKIEITPDVKLIIECHHERFDGNGFPNKLSGFKIPEVSQLVSLADVMADILNMGFDGDKRTPQEALEKLDSMQNASGKPSYFNPELYSTVTQAIRDSKTSMAEAEKIAKEVAKAS